MISTTSNVILATSIDPATSSFSWDEIEALRHFMPSLDTSTPSPQTSFTQLGTFAFAFTASVSSLSHSWIIDSRAFYHMIGTSSFFSLYSLCSRKDKVRIADGSYFSITSKGRIPITLSLQLSFVLHVPQFTLNLLSMSSDKVLNCSIIFSPSHCVFQDLGSRGTIGRGHKDNGLYILDVPPHSTSPVQ